jgi:hypothetical protein
MTLHLIKLCVGAESIDDLNEWIAYRHLMSGSKEALREHVHITRMMPKRKSELLEGGSLYWVIKGLIACRQQLLDIRAFRDDDGISRCALVLSPAVMPVSARPFRPFQGWRFCRKAIGFSTGFPLARCCRHSPCPVSALFRTSARAVRMSRG